MRWSLAAALLATLVFAVAACGGGDESEEAGETGERVRVSLTDFKIDPADIHLDRAGSYTFVVTNDGESPHAFEIEGGGIEEASSTLDAGDSDEFTVDLEEGEYETYCPVGDHADRGMTGTLTVGESHGAETGTEMETETETGETETETETETGETETGEGLGY